MNFLFSTSEDQKSKMSEKMSGSKNDCCIYQCNSSVSSLNKLYDTVSEMTPHKTSHRNKLSEHVNCDKATSCIDKSTVRSMVN